MQIVTFVFFLAALLLALGVIAQMFIANGSRILEALAGGPNEVLLPEAEVVYLRPRNEPVIEWRKAA